MRSRAADALKSLAIITVSFAYLLVLSAPLSLPAYAEDVPPAESEPVCLAPEGSRLPTGADAFTFAYNCATGLWENAYYILDTYTGVRTPKYTPGHVFNSTLNLWEVYEWIFNAPAGVYQYQVTNTYAPLATANTDTDASISNTGPNSDNMLTDSNGTIQNTGPNSSNSIDGTGGLISNTGPSSSNDITLNPDGSAAYDLNIDASLTTNLNSTSVSGDASVLQNTVAGDAETGDALAMANIINMIQSTLGWEGTQPQVYTADIQGDYFGDILIDPSLLASTASPGCGCGDLTVNASVNGTIENNVNLLAQSGDATVSGNTEAGGATTGDATAVANIVNMINSSIMAGESFIGVINIDGNFEGDVLMSEDVINELIAANVPTVDISLCGCGDLTADLDASFNIDNNITTTAASGNVDVLNNTEAGSATSGSADTSVTVFNLTGRSVVGQDALLVFVNVGGEWIGFITNAPDGATAAALGGGLISNTTGGDADFDIDTTASIYNNVNVGAYSGDAEVSGNTRAGDARSGDAYAAANVANFASSNFSLSGWFGILFINVSGDWHGSFGTDTAYGGFSTQVPDTSQKPSGVAGAVSTSGTNGSAASARSMRTYAVSFTSDDSGNAALAAATEVDPADIAEVVADQNFGAPDGGNDYTLLVMFGVLVVAYVVIFRSDWINAILRRN